MRREIVLSLLVCMVLASCTKRDPVLFEIPFRLNFEVGAGLSPVQKYFYLVADQPSNIAALKSQFDVGEDEVLSIRPASAIFSSVLQEVDFTFIEEIEISVYEGTDPEDDTTIFLTDIVPVNAGRNVNVLPFDDVVTEFIDKPFVNFKVGMRFRAPTPISIQGNIDIIFTAE